MRNQNDERNQRNCNEDNNTLGDFVNDVRCSRRNRCFEKALEDAYRKGYKKGFEEGYQEGYCEGYQDGVKDGYEKAKEEVVCFIKRNRCCC